MTRAKWLALAARCEAAQGPDRELDDNLHCAMATLEHPPTAWAADCSGRIGSYTGSIDAALTLTDWVLLHLSDCGADGLPLAVLGNPSTTPAGEVRGICLGGARRGRGLARALSAASCRAWAEMCDD